jgi:hypothetical protein
LYKGVMNRTLPLVIYPSPFFDPVWPISDKISPLDDNPYRKYVLFINKLYSENLLRIMP